MTSTRRGFRLKWTHVDGGRGQSPCGRPHRNLKLESTDVILSSFHARKLASFYQNFVFGRKEVEIFRRYKLVIKIINSTVLNKLQSYSRISALGPEESDVYFMSIACGRPQGGGGPHHVDRGKGRGQKPDFLWTS